MQRKLLLTCVLSFVLASSGQVFLSGTSVQAATSETTSSVANVRAVTMPKAVDTDDLLFSFSFTDPFKWVRAILQSVQEMQAGHETHAAHSSRVVNSSHAKNSSQITHHITQSGNHSTTHTTHITEIRQSGQGTQSTQSTQISYAGN